MKCFLCGGDKFKTVYTNDEFKILACPDDDLHFKIATKKQNNLYDKDYFASYPYSNFLNLNKIYFKNKLNLLRRLKLPKRPKILDVGCGWGDFLEACRDENIRYLGVDESPEAIAICKKKGLHCKIARVPVSNALSGADPAAAGEHAHWLEKRGTERFDIITLFQVIEHIQNPLPLLKSARKLLAPGGIILITTPNNDSPLRKLTGPKWSVYNTDSHFVFYNKQTLKQTFEMAGFKNVVVKIDSPRFFSLSYILSRLFHKNVNCQLSIVNCLSIPTDPFGDIQAIGFKT